jgi:hypothetical protein
MDAMECNHMYRCDGVGHRACLQLVLSVLYRQCVYHIYIQYLLNGSLTSTIICYPDFGLSQHLHVYFISLSVMFYTFMLALYKKIHV